MNDSIYRAYLPRVHFFLTQYNYKAMSSQSCLDEHFYNLRNISSGGLSDIYLAEDRISGQTIVLKTLKDEYSLDKQRRERFKNEASLQSLIRHPNVVQVFDYLEIGVRQFIVMEYVEGEPFGSIKVPSKIGL